MLVIYDRLNDAVRVQVMHRFPSADDDIRKCHGLDQRPNAPGQQYPVYADGRRMVSTGRRDEWYCPACKRH